MVRSSRRLHKFALSLRPSDVLSSSLKRCLDFPEVGERGQEKPQTLKPLSLSFLQRLEGGAQPLRQAIKAPGVRRAGAGPFFCRY